MEIYRNLAELDSTQNNNFNFSKSRIFGDEKFSKEIEEIFEIISSRTF